MTDAPDIVTAAILVIGDEILSGRTKDRNIGYIAEYLARVGVDVREARVVPDVEEEIVAAINALRARYDYLFTTGGIGPTHDDITADSGRQGARRRRSPRIRAPSSRAARAHTCPEDLNEARRRMARIPHGADLIENAVSKAPGFMDRQRDRDGGRAVGHASHARQCHAAELGGPAPKIIAETIDASGLPEGALCGGARREVARPGPACLIGSYPSFVDGAVSTTDRRPRQGLCRRQRKRRKQAVS